MEEISPFEEVVLADYPTLGVHCCDDVLAIGDPVHPSRIWDDGRPTDEYLPGTSTIGIRWDYEEWLTIEEALAKLEPYYWQGRHVYLLASEYSGQRGVDNDELIMREAFVVAAVAIPSEANTLS